MSERAIKSCVRGGFGPRSESGHCRCDACRAHYADRAKRLAERVQSLKICKRGNLAPRGKWGHCLCVDCLEARRQSAAKSSAKWVSQNPESRKALVLAWRLKNPEKVAEMSYKAGAKWSKKNSGARQAIAAKRKAARIQRTPAWACFDQIREFYTKAAELTKATGIPHEVDHIIPLQGDVASGLHVQNNLQILTRSANRSKRNKVPECLRG